MSSILFGKFCIIAIASLYIVAITIIIIFNISLKNLSFRWINQHRPVISGYFNLGILGSKSIFNKN
uniref:Uncharacterized protein n=1 Tax=Tetranychus urticae TaxID=32264 RepID=T1JXJ7_TETUR